MNACVSRWKSKGTIVMGSSVHPPDRPSIDTILSPQLLLQFSRDFDEAFQLLFPLPEDMHCFHYLKICIFYRGHARLIFTRVMAL